MNSPAQEPLFSGAIGVLDYRHFGRRPDLLQAVQPYLSDDGFVAAMVKVEVALVDVLARRGICTPDAAEEVRRAGQGVRPADVHAQQLRVRHPVMALVNCLRAAVSPDTQRFIHLTATTNDIVCSADAWRYKAFASRVLLPRLLRLARTLIGIARRERATVQIGRTHGMHAEPVTFGWSLAHHLSRLGRAIDSVHRSALDLRGKLSGAVGAHNAASLFFDDAREFEREVLRELGLEPSPTATQIVEAEFLVDHAHAMVSCFGIVANIADDMRQLHRSEIGEVEEYFAPEHVGSSTMPHKRNPTRFENVKSLWKVFMPRMATLYMDQLSEHQRDLTNFESTLFVGEIGAGLFLATDILDRTLEAMVVRGDRMQANLALSAGLVVAEPAQLMLARLGHAHAHEAVRVAAGRAREHGIALLDAMHQDVELRHWLDQLSDEQRQILEDPARYIGTCIETTDRVCDDWEARCAALEAGLAGDAVQPHN